MEIDLTTMRNRLERLEVTMADTVPNTPSGEAIAANAFQRKKGASSTKSFPSIRVGEPDGDVTGKPFSGPVRKGRSAITVGDEEPRKTSSSADGQGIGCGTVLEVPIGKAGQAMAVKAPQGDYVVLEFLPNRAVKAVYRGQTIRRLAPEGKDVVQLTLPQ